MGLGDTTDNHEPVTAVVQNYRTSRFFLEDQLRCSEAVREFRSFRALVGNMPAFNVRRTIEFSYQPVRTDNR